MTDTHKDFFAGICVGLQVLTAQDEGVAWGELVRACNVDDLLQYAAHVEPDEWELAGFKKYAKLELGKRKPAKRVSAPAAVPSVDSAVDVMTKAVAQLADWLLTEPNDGNPLCFAGAPEPTAYGMSRVNMRSVAGKEWTLFAGLHEGWESTLEPNDAAITTCALMIHAVCAIKPKEEWLENFEKRIRWMLFKDSTDPTPAHTEAVAPIRLVGDSRFEGWFSQYSAAGKGDKQRARDAYSAGMNDSTAAVAQDAAVGAQGHRFDAVELILRDVCETDPADPDLNDTVCIDISDLKTIVERHIGTDSLLEWAVERWNAEVAQRPLVNVHRRALDDTWRQVIRQLGGDPAALIGPSHSDLLGAAPHPRASDAQIVPDGWKLVPVEPTEDMAKAYLNPSMASWRQRYAAMLAASPAAPQEQPATSHALSDNGLRPIDTPQPAAPVAPDIARELAQATRLESRRRVLC